MQPCKGLPHNPDQGFTKVCPLRWKCARYAKFEAGNKALREEAMQGPYDFDDEECGKFLDK